MPPYESPSPPRSSEKYSRALSPSRGPTSIPPPQRADSPPQETKSPVLLHPPALHPVSIHWLRYQSARHLRQTYCLQNRSTPSRSKFPDRKSTRLNSSHVALSRM